MQNPKDIPGEPLPPPHVAVASSRLSVDGLRTHFARAPQWQPESRAEPQLKPGSEPRDAAVLMALVPRDELMLVLTQRPVGMATHAGQVALPGGKVDPGDASAVAAALREAHEEIGLQPQHAEVLGALPTYLTGTGFQVTPVVALVSGQAPWQPHPREVDEVFEVPMSHLMNPAHHFRHAHLPSGVPRAWWSMPYQDGTRERFIWGATAGMLRNLYRFLLA
ncbi:MAG: CoA pyrophosphatase [Proteobacteria bacterium]|nr:CoA pyrophosphatase [Pseudomonadota bacterium]